MRLRSIPPKTACKRAPRQRACRLRSAPEAQGAEPAWYPHIHERAKQAPGLLTRQHVDAEVAKNIARLTEEIDQWLEELGESALLALDEERARWAEGTSKYC